jgi:predicted transcriptional regulator of viral defense system
MQHLDQPYYVGLLSAAGLHGASHQAVQVFQVVTDRPTRTVEVGRVRGSFVQSRRLGETPVVRMNTATGTMAVSTPEATAFDLVRFRSTVGGLSHVATVLAELAESIDPSELVRVAEAVEVAVVQRTGFLLELVGALAPATTLAEWLADVGPHPVALRPDVPAVGAHRNSRWRVVVNDEVEPDL